MPINILNYNQTSPMIFLMGQNASKKKVGGKVVKFHTIYKKIPIIVNLFFMRIPRH